jgi:hypothetical protein
MSNFFDGLVLTHDDAQDEVARLQLDLQRFNRERGSRWSNGFNARVPIGWRPLGHGRPLVAD